MCRTDTINCLCKVQTRMYDCDESTRIMWVENVSSMFEQLGRLSLDHMPNLHTCTVVYKYRNNLAQS